MLVALALLTASCKLSTAPGPVSSVAPAPLVRAFHAQLLAGVARFDLVLDREAAELNQTYDVQVFLDTAELDLVLRLVEGSAGTFPVRRAAFDCAGPGGWCEVVGQGTYSADGRRLRIEVPLLSPAVYHIQASDPPGSFVWGESGTLAEPVAAQ